MEKPRIKVRLWLNCIKFIIVGTKEGPRTNEIEIKKDVIVKAVKRSAVILGTHLRPPLVSRR